MSAAKPTAEEARALREQLDALVLVQTNVFIRELLRELRRRPGANKEEFRQSLDEAIEDGSLTLEKLQGWLRAVEGWGNQHVYAFALPEPLAGAASWRDEAAVEAFVQASPFGATWRASVGLDVPYEPTITRIDFVVDEAEPAPGGRRRRILLVDWHERTDSWVRDSQRDKWPRERLPRYANRSPVALPAVAKPEETLLIDGDVYRFDAFRLRPARSVMRFGLLVEPAVAERPIAALFVRVAMGKEHDLAVEKAWSDLARLAPAGVALARVKDEPWPLSDVIKNMDDAVAHDQTRNVKSKKTRFKEGLAEVEFVAPPDLTLPTIIREVRLAIPADAIRNPDFLGAEGDFHVERGDPDRRTSRAAHVQLFQSGNRIRIWTELEERDVWAILETLDGYR